MENLKLNSKAQKKKFRKNWVRAFGSQPTLLITRVNWSRLGRSLLKKGSTNGHTYGDENIESSGDRRLQVGVQYDCPELHFVSRLIDCLVGLDEHRVTLVDVFEGRGVGKLQTTWASGSQVVITRSDIADL